MTSMGEDSLDDWLHGTVRWSTQAQHGSVASLCWSNISSISAEAALILVCCLLVALTSQLAPVRTHWYEMWGNPRLHGSS